MKTIKERAKKWCKETFGCFLKTEATCYYQGAIDQQKIDIDKACKWLSNCESLQMRPYNIEQFRKAIEE